MANVLSKPELDGKNKKISELEERLQSSEAENKLLKQRLQCAYKGIMDLETVEDIKRIKEQVEMQEHPIQVTFPE